MTGELTLAAGQLAGALGRPANQPDLLEARQMQAMSFAVHIPLVCFGIAFPAMVLFVEGLWLRTGDPAYKALAKRWSKVMLILFAVGVVTGTILSFEMGLLWPAFMADFGEVEVLVVSVHQLVGGLRTTRRACGDPPSSARSAARHNLTAVSPRPCGAAFCRAQASGLDPAILHRSDVSGQLAPLVAAFPASRIAPA